MSEQGEPVTPDEVKAAEAATRERWLREGDLTGWLCERIWEHGRPFRLGETEFETAGWEEVPGYTESDSDTLFLRDVSSGQVYEVDVEVSMTEVKTPEELAAQLEKFRAWKQEIERG